MDAALAAASTLVAVAFACSTLDRWLRRRRPHELVFSVSLALFALGAGAFWWAEADGWSLGTFRVFYLAGAILNVPWLALGTVFLLASERVGRGLQRVLVFASGLATGVLLVAPSKRPVAGGEMPSGREVFGAVPRVMAAVGSGVGATVVIVGALWSVWRLLRDRSPSWAGTRHVAHAGGLAIGNVLIAVGTLVLSGSGSLAGSLGHDRAFAVTLLIGIAVLFAGFLVASSASRRATAGAPRLRRVA
jgi:hypothetical protein